MRVRFALAVLAAASTFVYVNAQSSVEGEVTKADEQYVAAMRSFDKAALQEFLTEDYTATNHTGSTSTKQQVLSRSPNNHPLPRDRKVRVYNGHTALVTSILDNPDVGPVRQLRVWVKHGNRWRIVAGQGTRIASSAGSD